MKKSEAKQQLINLLDRSDLCIMKEIEWEGGDRDDDATNSEKKRIVEQIMKIVYPK